jgi:hypothetical protein
MCPGAQWLAWRSVPVILPGSPLPSGIARCLASLVHLVARLCFVHFEHADGACCFYAGCSLAVYWCSSRIGCLGGVRIRTLAFRYMSFSKQRGPCQHSRCDQNAYDCLALRAGGARVFSYRKKFQRSDWWRAPSKLGGFGSFGFAA